MEVFMNTLIIVALVVWTIVGLGFIVGTALMIPVYYPMFKMTKNMFKRLYFSFFMPFVLSG